MARGRPKGSKNKATFEFRKFCADITNSREYQESVRARLLEGSLHPAMEKAIIEQAHGRPNQAIDLKADVSVSLAERMKAARERARKGGK